MDDESRDEGAHLLDAAQSLPLCRTVAAIILLVVVSREVDFIVDIHDIVVCCTLRELRTFRCRCPTTLRIVQPLVNRGSGSAILAVCSCNMGNANNWKFI